MALKKYGCYYVKENKQAGAELCQAQDKFSLV